MMGDKYGADFIGFQEVLKHQVTELQEMLPQYSWWVLAGMTEMTGGEFLLILYRADRFNFMPTNTFWLSESPYYPGSKS